VKTLSVFLNWFINEINFAMIPVMAFAAQRQTHPYFIFCDKKLWAGLCIILLGWLGTSPILAQDTIPVIHESVHFPADTVSPASQPDIRRDATLIVSADSLIVDTVESVKRMHSPIKATMLSATVPGLGQIYNGRTWKVPIIYAGYAGIAYALNFNNTYYQRYRRAWIADIDGNPNTVSEFPYISTDRLLRATNYYRRNLELTYIIAAALYVLNILDATVDAHLLDFDVGEDLTLNIRPTILPKGNMGGFSNNLTGGISLSFRF
jgi:hypothetical protein